MTAFNITIDGKPVGVTSGQSILDAARKLQIDIPTLCYLEKCGPLNSCQVCLVKVNGKLVPACGTHAQPSMVVESETAEVHEARRTALELLFSEHVGDCLAPCHKLCPLEMNIPVLLRQIQAGHMEEAVVTVREALPLAGILGRLCHHPCEQGCRRGSWDDPAAIRDLERLVSDQDSDHLPSRKPLTGKSVAIVGSGPTGLAAAWYLLREGHACTIVDRQKAAGGSLRQTINEESLPVAVMEAELEQLKKLGAQFQLGVALGRDVTLSGLLRGFSAVLIATGEVSVADGPSLGIEMASAGIKSHPQTYQTSHAAVFAAGRAVKPITHLVRALSDGRSAAACMHQFLSGHSIRHRERPFSSVMGRMDKDELTLLLKAGYGHGSVTPCDACAGLNRQEAAMEASRCLHCDCRSSGHCALQFYAQAYGADASRYRRQRPKFEQHIQPGGVIFEPGKCILCGICVRLTELAAEPLGLAFIGRGFDVRVGAPFGCEFEKGLQKVAAECVEHCPTGALALQENRQLDLLQ